MATKLKMKANYVVWILFCEKIWFGFCPRVSVLLIQGHIRYPLILISVAVVVVAAAVAAVVVVAVVAVAITREYRDSRL